MIDKTRLRDLLHPVLRYLSFSLPITRDGRRLWIPIQEGTGLGVYELVRSGSEDWKLDLFRAMLAIDSGIFVDIGANLGQTLIQLRQLDADRPYLGFEPNPDCLHYIYTLMRRNAFEHVDLLAVGIGAGAGILSLYLPRGRSTDSTATLHRDLRPGRDYDARHVPIFTETYLGGVLGGRPIALVKIDVEGAELDVLKGLRQCLMNHRPPVLCEVLFTDPKGDLAASRTRNAEIMQWLRGLRYRVWRIRKSSRGERLTGLDPVDDFGTDYYSPANADLCDYLFLPVERADVLLSSLNPPERVGPG